MISRKTPVTAPRRSRARNELESRRCDNCNTSFKPKRETQRFCSDKCRRVARNLDRRKVPGSTNCEFCGKELIGKRIHAKYCNSTCRRDAFNAKQIP